MLNSHLDMRLRMIMKAPVCRTAAGVESFLSDSQLAAARTLQFSHRGLVGHIWRQYADSLISNTDSGMECCESAEEILRELAAAPGRPAITRTGRSLWRIGGSSESGDGCVFLSEDEDGGIYLHLDSAGEKLDISDFGPGSAAELILNLLGAYGKLDEYCSKIS